MLSSCAWAAGRILEPGPRSTQWLKGFEEQARIFSNDFIERFKLPDAQGVLFHENNIPQGINIGKPLIYEDLLSLSKNIAEKLGLLCAFEKEISIRIKSTKISVKKEYALEDLNFLNSFYLEDIKNVSQQITRGNCGKALKVFLTPEENLDKKARTNIQRSPDLLFETLSPDNFPTGAWPNKGGHPLVLSQQLAVNKIMQSLNKNSGIISVNGPPGTGKTTLLRDLVASIVVERAKCLMHYTSASQGFESVCRWDAGQYTRSVALWKKELRGFEIVLASSNNGAVENVTMEIPAKNAVDPSCLNKSDYFRELATSFLGQPA